MATGTKPGNNTVRPLLVFITSKDDSKISLTSQRDEAKVEHIATYILLVKALKNLDFVISTKRMY